MKYKVSYVPKQKTLIEKTLAQNTQNKQVSKLLLEEQIKYSGQYANYRNAISDHLTPLSFDEYVLQVKKEEGYGIKTWLFCSIIGFIIFILPSLHSVGVF